jgi:hypothetical protein
MIAAHQFSSFKKNLKEAVTFLLAVVTNIQNSNTPGKRTHQSIYSRHVMEAYENDEAEY